MADHAAEAGVGLAPYASRSACHGPYERGGNGQFHDGLLMDLIRDDLAL